MAKLNLKQDLRLMTCALVSKFKKLIMKSVLYKNILVFGRNSKIYCCNFDKKVFHIWNWPISPSHALFSGHITH